MSLLNDTASHDLYLARLASGILNDKLYPAQESLYKQVRLLLLDAENITSRKQLATLTKAVKLATQKAMAEAWAETTKELSEVAVYEAAFYAQLLGAYGAVELSVPKAKTITDYVDEALMLLTNKSGRTDVGTWVEFVSGNISAHAQEFDNIVRAGVRNKQSMSQVASTIKAATEGVLRRDAQSLARTGMQHYAIQARDAMANDNLDIIDRRYYNTVFDNRRTLLCASRHAKTWRMDDESYPALPAHYNCLSEDTLVTTCSDVSNVYKRRYKGVMVNFTTRSGRSVKITPNHPVLTARGWVKAGELNLTDKVVTVESVRAFAGEDYKNSIVAEFGKLFSSVNILANPNLVAIRPTSTEDFHGDITDTYVKVVKTDGLSWDSVRKAANNSIKNNPLPFGSFVKAALHSLCSLFFFGNTANPTSGSLMSRFGKGGNLLRCAFGHSCKLLFRPVSESSINWFQKLSYNCRRALDTNVISNTINANSRFVSGNNVFLIGLAKLNKSWIFKFNARCGNPLVNESNRNAEKLSNFDWHNTRGAKFDDLISVEFFEYDGHVYNLENKDNWYLSNGIITHNCRSSWLFLLKGQTELPSTRAAVGGRDTAEAKRLFEEKQERLQALRDKRAEERAEGKATPETASQVRYKGKADANIFKPGQIDANIGVDTWLREQPQWYIEDTLGKTKAKLFMSGEYKLERFVDATGRSLTIKELRERDEALFKRILGG